MCKTREVKFENWEMAKEMALVRDFEVGDLSTQETMTVTLYDKAWIKQADR